LRRPFIPSLDKQFERYWCGNAEAVQLMVRAAPVLTKFE
jgi:hypothetical protein